MKPVTTKLNKHLLEHLHMFCCSPGAVHLNYVHVLPSAVIFPHQLTACIQLMIMVRKNYFHVCTLSDFKEDNHKIVYMDRFHYLEFCSSQANDGRVQTF